MALSRTNEFRLPEQLRDFLQKYHARRKRRLIQDDGTIYFFGEGAARADDFAK